MQPPEGAKWIHGVHPYALLQRNMDTMVTKGVFCMVTQYERESRKIVTKIQDILMKADETKDIDDVKDALAMAKLLVSTLEHESYL